MIEKIGQKDTGSNLQSLLKIIICKFVDEIESILLQLEHEQSTLSKEQQSSFELEFATRSSFQPPKILIENQNIYKTLQLIRSSILPTITSLYLSSYFTNFQSGSQIHEASTQQHLVLCLRLRAMNIEPGRNQNQTKIMPSASQLTLEMNLQKLFRPPTGLTEILDRTIEECRKNGLQDTAMAKHIVGVLQLVAQVVEYLGDNLNNKTKAEA